MGDLDDFLKYGQQLLSGTYNPRYPLPMQGVFVFLSLLPRPVVIALVVGLSLLCLLHLFKRRALLWIFYAPILQCLALGNLDVIALWIMVRASPVSLALLTLKPQLFLFALPTLYHRRELWKPFIGWCALLWGIPTLIYPQWVGQFIAGGDDRIVAGTSASLWPVPFAALLLIFYMAVSHRWQWRVIVSSLNPLLRSYDYTMLAGASAWLVPVSWLCVWLMWRVVAAWPMSLVGVAVLAVEQTRTEP